MSGEPAAQARVVLSGDLANTASRAESSPADQTQGSAARCSAATCCYRSPLSRVDSGQPADTQTLTFRYFKMLDEVRPEKPLPLFSHFAHTHKLLAALL